MLHQPAVRRRRIPRVLCLPIAAWIFAALSPSAGAAALPEIEVEVAFPNLTFDQPVLLTAPPDGSDRIFVVERKGTIRVFPNDPEVSETSTFFSITATDGLRTARGEEGLLGLAFDPDYANNRYFYINYTAID
ncbi:MAG: PQQ-dependent sugar dehydrogenase, partial [Deltaproteobacteria bacterium]|nr:PQQ-dependent sugar dehydrogenase [Deltaproteobacteria bacterium]